MELYAYIYFSINDFKLFKILSISPQFDLYDPIMYKVHSTLPYKVRQLHFYLIFIIYVVSKHVNLQYMKKLALKSKSIENLTYFL